LLVIYAKQAPPVGVVLWHIPAPAAVALGRRDVLAEILDERLACFELFLILREPESLARVFQRSREAER
jgi:hypothetical protein